MAEQTPESTPANDSTMNADAAAPIEAVETGSKPSSEPEGGKFDLLSVVRDAVAKPAEDSASPAGQDVSNPPSPGEDASASPQPDDDEAFSDVPFNNHPRFKKLIQQRNELRKTAEVHAQDAQRYRNVETFLEQNGMNGDEAAEMIKLGALMKSNPVEAWKQLQPKVRQLLVDAGEVLPQDLLARVQKGEMTKAAAVELSRARAALANGQRAQEMSAKQAQAREAQAAHQAILNAVAEWETQAKVKDPEFGSIYEDLQREIVWITRTKGPAKTPEDARKLADEAYATVTKRRRGAVPAPKPVARPVTGGRVASGNPPAKPTTMLDIVRGARAQG